MGHRPELLRRGRTSRIASRGPRDALGLRPRSPRSRIGDSARSLPRPNCASGHKHRTQLRNDQTPASRRRCNSPSQRLDLRRRRRDCRASPRRETAARTAPGRPRARRRHHGRFHSPVAQLERAAHRCPERRTERHLLRAQAEPPGDPAATTPTVNGPLPLSRPPAQPAGAASAPLATMRKPQLRNLAGPLRCPRDGFRGTQERRTGCPTAHRGPRSAVPLQRRPATAPSTLALRTCCLRLGPVRAPTAHSLNASIACASRRAGSGR